MGSMEDGWKRIIRELQDIVKALLETTTPVGQTGLVAPTDTTCVLADTWYPVTGPFTDEIDINDGFVVDTGEFKSLTEGKTTFGGSGNFSASKQCKITLGLFVDGVNLAKANTNVDFATPLKVVPASRTVAFTRAIDDVFDIRVMSDTADTDVTIAELNALFIGLRS